MDNENKDYENDGFQAWNDVDPNVGNQEKVDTITESYYGLSDSESNVHSISNQELTMEEDTTEMQDDSMDIKNEMQEKTETQEKAELETNVEESKSTSTKILEEIISWVKVIIVALVLSLILNKFVFFNFTVPTESMENTIMVDNRIMSLRCAYLFSDPKRGDIIVFPFPDDPEETYIKRVIGLPGETIEGKDGLVYINGEALAEDYVTSELDDDFGPYEIPEDSYFVLGDNRYVSLDARYWDNKFVKRDDIISKAVFRFYPGFKILK